MALLVKQGWRLLQNPDSLAAKILKEKYYPHGTFLCVAKLLECEDTVAGRAFLEGGGWAQNQHLV